jgi:hypothetical protein
VHRQREPRAAGDWPSSATSSPCRLQSACYPSLNKNAPRMLCASLAASRRPPNQRGHRHHGASQAHLGTRLLTCSHTSRHDTTQGKAAPDVLCRIMQSNMSHEPTVYRLVPCDRLLGWGGAPVGHRLGLRCATTWYTVNDIGHRENRRSPPWPKHGKRHARRLRTRTRPANPSIATQVHDGARDTAYRALASLPTRI